MHEDEDIGEIEWPELLIGVILGCALWALIGAIVFLLLRG